MAECTFTIQSEPGCDVTIDVGTADLDGLTDGDTFFTRRYTIAAGTVTFTAPATKTWYADAEAFVRWELDGVAQPDGVLALAISTDQDHVAIAIYDGCSSLEHVCLKADGTLVVQVDGAEFTVCTSSGAKVAVPPCVPAGRPTNYPLFVDQRRTPATNPSWGTLAIHLRGDWAGDCGCSDDCGTSNTRASYTVTWPKVSIDDGTDILVLPGGSHELPESVLCTFDDVWDSPYIHEPECVLGDQHNMAELALSDKCAVDASLLLQFSICHNDDETGWGWTSMLGTVLFAMADFDCETGISLQIEMTWVGHGASSIVTVVVS